MAALSQAGVATWGVVVVSSILFGLAHAYQGVGGIISTGVMGIVFALVRIVWGSLLPVMVFHAIVDVVAGVAGPKHFSRPVIAE
jgi:membrane protease YdiL (CAAX protease family)